MSIPGMSASPPADSSFDIWTLIETVSRAGLHRGVGVSKIISNSPRPAAVGTLPSDFRTCCAAQINLPDLSGTVH